MDEEPTAEAALKSRARLECDGLAREVLDRDEQLETVKRSVLERPARSPSRGRSGDATKGGRGPDPVAEVAEAETHVDLVDAATTEDTGVVVKDDELESCAGLACGGLLFDPTGGIREAIGERTPRSPGMELLDGLSNGCKERLDVVRFGKAQCDVHECLRSDRLTVGVSGERREATRVRWTPG